MKKISLLVADDHAVVRQGLRFLLRSAPDMEVVGEAENGRQAVQKAKRLRPKVVVMDLAMPLLDGVQATRELRKKAPSAKVLALSTYSDARSVRRMLEAGALGYVVKQSAGEELLQAIRAVNQGKVYLSPKVEQFARDYRRMGGSQPATLKAGSRLSLRESEVLQLVAEGFSSKEISGGLKVSVQTVRALRRNLMKKLDLQNTAGLARYALSGRMVEGRRVEAR